ncbi:MAG: hypothetical protein K2H46_00950 [Muribaculaceae bacterium]|nr:hypothetical protein [Muribaculaceae bacterium]
MKKIILLPILIFLLISGGACVRLKKPDSAQKHEQWVESLNDSVDLYKKQADSVADALSSMKEKVARLIPDFTHVSNPREVDGYYVYKGWASHFPLTSTSLVARISENEGLELIAALSGGVFNQISLSSGSQSVSSAIVPHDQALNYRAGNINTVCFSGAEADSVAAFIAANKDSAITVNFVGGARGASMSLSPEAKEMIAASWQLYSTQKESHRLEKMLPLLSRKVDLCRRMLHESDSAR